MGTFLLFLAILFIGAVIGAAIVGFTVAKDFIDRIFGKG